MSDGNGNRDDLLLLELEIEIVVDVVSDICRWLRR